MFYAHNPPPLNPMPKKQTFTVYVRYLVTVEVEAANEAEAERLGLRLANEQGEFETLDVTVENPYPDA